MVVGARGGRGGGGGDNVDGGGAVVHAAHPASGRAPVDWGCDKVSHFVCHGDVAGEQGVRSPKHRSPKASPRSSQF